MESRISVTVFKGTAARENSIGSTKYLFTKNSKHFLTAVPVSYTHLDVYKRQTYISATTFTVNCFHVVF